MSGNLQLAGLELVQCMGIMQSILQRAQCFVCKMLGSVEKSKYRISNVAGGLFNLKCKVNNMHQVCHQEEISAM